MPKVTFFSFHVSNEVPLNNSHFSYFSDGVNSSPSQHFYLTVESVVTIRGWAPDYKLPFKKVSEISPTWAIHQSSSDLKMPQAKVHIS